MPTIDIGFSPCPNDTFIFDALVNHKIDTKGYDFQLHLEDVQTLNEWALQGKLPYSKISYGVWPKLKNQYQLLESGGALGKGVGPLFTKRTIAIYLESQMKKQCVLLFQAWIPQHIYYLVLPSRILQIKFF
jgi:1,4-dihydroxy-6-naphthoate synthase